MHTCDARQGGTALRNCSNDRVKVWHGHEAPAITCGFHATYDAISVFRGHEVREGTRDADTLALS